ncbi:MAG: hypothetical protein ACRESZ_22610 [Methylococcales bacterium]
MTYLLFILTAVLVGYVLYALCFSDAGRVSSDLPDTKPTAVELPGTAKEPAPIETESLATASFEPARAQSKATAESTDSNESGPNRYRNPETGETAAVPTNYRFAKRWIKRALVTEGLLDRVYTNSELDDKTFKKTKTALDKFKEIKKYHA